MAQSINFNNLQLNTITPQLRSEQRIAAQNITRIDKTIASIDKEIELTKNYIVNNNKIIKACQESKAIIQEEMDMVISILKDRGVAVIKQNGIWVEDTNNLNSKLNNSKKSIEQTKKIELASQKLTEAEKKIEAIEKYSQNLNFQPVVKKNVVISTYKPTSTQLSTLVRSNYVFNQSNSENTDIKQKYSLPVIYQSQQNIYESIVNNFLKRLV
jgi:hypothetical protein